MSLCQNIVGLVLLRGLLLAIGPGVTSEIAFKRYYEKSFQHIMSGDYDYRAKKFEWIDLNRSEQLTYQTPTCNKYAAALQLHQANSEILLRLTTLQASTWKLVA